MTGRAPQLVRFLNEKASERRKHPRNMRAADLLADAADAPADASPPPTDGTAPAAPAQQAASPSPLLRLRFRGAAGDDGSPGRSSPGGPRPPAGGGGGGGDDDGDERAAGGGGGGSGGGGGGSSGGGWDERLGGDVAADYVMFQRSPTAAGGAVRSAAAVRARFVVLKRLESLVAGTLPLVDLARAREPGSAAARLAGVKGRLFEATKMHLWDAAMRITQACPPASQSQPARWPATPSQHAACPFVPIPASPVPLTPHRCCPVCLPPKPPSSVHHPLHTPSQRAFCPHVVARSSLTRRRRLQDRKDDIPAVTVYRGPAAAAAVAAAAGRRRRARRPGSVDDAAGGTGSSAAAAAAAAAGEATVFAQLFSALEDDPLLRAKSKGKGLMAWQVADRGRGVEGCGLA